MSLTISPQDKKDSGILADHTWDISSSDSTRYLPQSPASFMKEGAPPLNHRKLSKHFGVLLGRAAPQKIQAI